MYYNIKVSVISIGDKVIGDKNLFKVSENKDVTLSKLMDTLPGPQVRNPHLEPEHNVP